MTNQIIWVVRGSEDGNVAIATSQKRAYEIACDYVGKSERKWLKYKREMGENLYGEIKLGGIYASIEGFYANQGVSI